MDRLSSWTTVTQQPFPQQRSMLNKTEALFNETHLMETESFSQQTGEVCLLVYWSRLFCVDVQSWVYRFQRRAKNTQPWRELAKV